MPDLFEPLRGSDDRLVRPPLPPDEVRRRGDRHRRRRALAAAAGSALAVVLVVGGGLALTDGIGSQAGPPLPPATQLPSETAEPTPDPMPEPPPDGGEWRTTGPVGFPIADDLEEPRSPDEELAGPGRDVPVFDAPFDACGRSSGLGAPVDTLAVEHTAPEWYDGRVLQVYGDAAAARQVLFELVRLYEFCEEDVFPGPPDTVAAATIRPVPHGEEGYVVTRTFSVDGGRIPGLELLHAVRVGNALLVSSLSNEGGSADENVARQLGERDPVIADVASAMCVFAPEGCGNPGESAPLELGPVGYGDLRLGMSAAEAEATGLVTLEDSHGEGCTTFTAEAGDGRVLGFLDGDRGVSVLLVDELGVRTPSGIGIGVGEERVRQAYPDAEEGPQGLRAQVPDLPDREYTFAFDHRRVAEMSLRLRTQECVG